MVSNFVTSLIRTWVPILVGAIISWAVSLGINVDNNTRGQMVIFMTALLTGIYYTLVRMLERKWPVLGSFLGAPGQPVYTAPEPQVPPVVSVAPPGPPPPVG